MIQETHASTPPPLLGCIADDVTGATDLATNLVQGGMRVVQTLGVPDAAALAAIEPVDAIVIALKSRSIAKHEAISQSRACLRGLQSIGVEHFYFKYCSTFDSTPAGNIGPVAEALMNDLGVTQTIFCPAFPRAGRTVYQGHLFVGDRLLHESGMQNHPINPMEDADLVRWLSKQSTYRVGLLSPHALRQDLHLGRQRLSELAEQDVRLVMVDCIDDSDLESIARLVAGMPLITGGSGLARYLPNAYRASGRLRSTPRVAPLPDVTGRSLILAGSCSTATNAQVDWMSRSTATWQIDVANVIADGSGELQKLKEWVAETQPQQTLLITSTTSPERVATLQNRFGIETVAAVVENYLAEVALMMVNEFDVRRLILAGGETSGAVVRALGIQMLQIGPEICTGVPWTQTIGHQPALALALKSGNFGDEEFFSVALEMLR